MNGTNSRQIIQGNSRVSCNPSEDLTDRPEAWSGCSYLLMELNIASSLYNESGDFNIISFVFR